MALSDAEKLEWLSNDNHRVVLMDLTYHNGTTTAVGRFSSYPYIQPAGDIWNTYSNLMYDDIISNVPNIITRIDSDSTIGAIDLLNTDGEYDWMLNDVTIVGHPIQLYIGEDSWIRDKYILILDGIISAVSSKSPENIQLTLRDRKETLNVTLQPDLIDQTYWDAKMLEIKAAFDLGGFPGTIVGGAGYSYAQAIFPEATKDTHIPIALGKCFNIEPVLIDSWNHIYLIHESLEGITAITEIRSNGIVLSGSQYEVDLVIGVIRLLDHAQGTQITCDIIGQNGASTLRLGGAPSLIAYSAADIIEWILLEKASIPPTDICYETFAPIGSAPFPNTDSLGIYYKTESTVLTVATILINSVGGFMRFKSAACKLQLILLDEPLGASVDLYLVSDDIVENGISITSIEEPKKSITIGYKKNWKTQDEGSLAGALTDASSPFYDIDRLNEFKNDYSTLVNSPSPVLDPLEYPLAEDVDLIETNIYDIADAQAELTRRIGLREQRRRVIRINSLATSFTYDIGDIVNITHPRFDLTYGKNAMIIGVEESPTNKRVTLDVWL